MPSIILSTSRTNLEVVAYDRKYPNLKELISIIITFTLTVFAWIFFRATSLTQAFGYIKGILTNKVGIEHFVLKGDLIILIILLYHWVDC